MQIQLILNLTDEQANELFSLIKYSIAKNNNIVEDLEKCGDDINLREDVSTRTANLFRFRGIKYYSQLTSMSRMEFLRFKGFGSKCLIEVNQLLASKGLSFRE